MEIRSYRHLKDEYSDPPIGGHLGQFHLFRITVSPIVPARARTFKLPERAEVVYDLFNQRELARDATEFHVTMRPASTALYYTGHAGMI